MDMQELVDLVGAVLGKTEEEVEQLYEDDCAVDDLIFDRYGIDLEQFEKVAKDLLKLTPIVETAITKTKYHAFVHDDVIIARAACA